WQALAGADARRAEAAAVWCWRNPERATALLRSGLYPDTYPDSRLEGLVAALSSLSYRKRMDAYRELQSAGFAAERSLTEAAENGPTAECRRLSSTLLQRLSVGPQHSNSVLRAARAIRILRKIQSPEAG